MTEDDWHVALRSARERLGLSRAELGRLSGVSPETLRAYEVGRRKPSRENLDTILEALKLERLEANQLRHTLGFSTDYLRLGLLEPTYMFVLEELRDEVEQIPWPEFVVDENMQVVVANSVAQKLWGVDLQWEFVTPAERNMLRVVTDPRFAHHLVNWDEMVGYGISIWKGHHLGPESLESPSAYFQAVLETLMEGDAAYVTRFFDVWASTRPKTPKVRDRHRVVWRDPIHGEMRFLAFITQANEWEGLAFNDWQPVDAETWQRLEALKAGRHSVNV